MVGELHVELVGGPLDGSEIVVPSLCACCEAEVTPGALFVSRSGERYVLGSNRGYAFHVERQGAARG